MGKYKDPPAINLVLIVICLTFDIIGGQEDTVPTLAPSPVFGILTASLFFAFLCALGGFIYYYFIYTAPKLPSARPTVQVDHSSPDRSPQVKPPSLVLNERDSLNTPQEPKRPKSAESLGNVKDTSALSPMVIPHGVFLNKSLEEDLKKDNKVVMLKDTSEKPVVSKQSSNERILEKRSSSKESLVQKKPSSETLAVQRRPSKETMLTRRPSTEDNGLLLGRTITEPPPQPRDTSGRKDYVTPDIDIKESVPYLDPRIESPKEAVVDPPMSRTKPDKRLKYTASVESLDFNKSKARVMKGPGRGSLESLEEKSRVKTRKEKSRKLATRKAKKDDEMGEAEERKSRMDREDKMDKRLDEKREERGRRNIKRRKDDGRDEDEDDLREERRGNGRGRKRMRKDEDESLDSRASEEDRRSSTSKRSKKRSSSRRKPLRRDSNESF